MSRTTPPVRTLGFRASHYAAGGLYLYYADQKRWDQENEKKQAQEANVLLWVVYDSKSCPAEFPLLLTISNLSSFVVNSVEWRYTAYRQRLERLLQCSRAPSASERP